MLKFSETRLYFSERVKSSAHGLSRINYIDLDNATSINVMFTSSFSVITGIASFQVRITLEVCGKSAVVAVRQTDLLCHVIVGVLAAKWFTAIYCGYL